MQFIERPVHPYGDVQALQASVLPDLIDHGRHSCPTQPSSTSWHGATHLWNKENHYLHCTTLNSATKNIASKNGRGGGNLRAQREITKENTHIRITAAFQHFALLTSLWHLRLPPKKATFFFLQVWDATLYQIPLPSLCPASFKLRFTSF